MIRKLVSIIISFMTSFLLTGLAQGSSFNRPDRGAPISDEERKVATHELAALLKHSRYFDFIDSRIHGIPENNSDGAFWYAHMWTGVVVLKEAGEIKYIHQKNGSDNVGIHTAPYLESACYAYRLTGNPKYAHLARKLIRGFSSWILSSSRSSTDTPKILSRSFYPKSFTTEEQGAELTVSYEASRPGIPSDASAYVHVANNPLFGDLWLKNNRSVDDIGHMIRAMAQVQACHDIFDEETRNDLDQMNALYADWARSVEQSKFIIPTFNSNAEIELRKGGIGDYNKFSLLGFNPNCSGKLAIHFLFQQNTNGFDCGNGISSLEAILRKQLQNDAVEILRSHHISSVAMAQLRSQNEVFQKLKEGLAIRLDRDFEIVKSPEKFPKMDVQDIPAELVHAHNVGMALTSEEIRFIYQRLHMAYEGMRSRDYDSVFHLFEPTTPDGIYSYEGPNVGLYFYTLGPMVGTCSSAWSKLSPRPLFDCEQIKDALSAN